jgi:PAB-dependent poly(A)-specific ribonuclease subunit 2
MECLFNVHTNPLSQQVVRIRFPPPGVQAMPTPVTTMAFDNSQELLWTGNDYVRAVSQPSNCE